FSPLRIFIAGWIARKFRLQKMAASSAQSTESVSRTRNGQELRTARRKFLMGSGFYPNCKNWAICLARSRFREPNGDANREGAASAEFAAQRDITAEQLRQLAHNREPETAALVFARQRIGGLAEFLEDALLLFRRDPHAGVGDVDGDAIALGFGPQNHAAAFGCELDRIG